VVCLSAANPSVLTFHIIRRSVAAWYSSSFYMVEANVGVFQLTKCRCRCISAHQMSVYFSSPNVDPVSAKDISRRFYMVEATVPTGHEQGRVREQGQFGVDYRQN
jgi:hypothetical protein